MKPTALGAIGEASNATGVNGDQSDNSAPDSGAAYLFVRNETNWSQQAYLKASNAGAGDEFGVGVGLSGDTAVIGAPHEGSNATGVNGNQSNNSAAGSGAVYIFVRNGTNWSQQAYLKASNTGAGGSGMSGLFEDRPFRENKVKNGSHPNCANVFPSSQADAAESQFLNVAC